MCHNRKHPEKGFQSTRPLRGETICTGGSTTVRCFFNPLAPCGARRKARQTVSGVIPFSIHSPLAGRDNGVDIRDVHRAVFQSTRPLRGETGTALESTVTGIFSIHSPLAGRDTAFPRHLSLSTLFNPLAPCGARLPFVFHVSVHLVFSIHSPLAGRDFHADSCRLTTGDFSIHSPLAGRDSKQSRKLSAKDIRVAQSTFPQIRQEAPQEEKRAVPAGKPAYIWCEPTGNLVCTAGSHHRISGSSIERTGDTP